MHERTGAVSTMLAYHLPVPRDGRRSLEIDVTSRAIRYAILACVSVMVTVCSSTLVAAQEPEAETIRDLGFVVELERMPPNLREDEFSKIKNVCIPPDWNGKMESLDILRKIQPRRFGQHTLYLLGPSKIAAEMVEPIAGQIGWKIGRAPAVFVGISWNSKTPPFTVLYVRPQSPASICGVVNGDTIKKIGAEEIRDYATFRDSLLEYLPGDETVLTLDRNGSELELTLKLTALPDDVNRPEN